MKVLDSSKILSSLGYNYILIEQRGSEPRRVDTRFSDLVPEFAKSEDLSWIAGQRLYEHQLRAFEELKKGNNVILKSGTGSGKTEAWFLYFYTLFKASSRTKALAVYPTLALANDQVKRLEKYCSAIGARALKLDASVKEDFARSRGLTTLRRLVDEANLIITNPAFAFHEFKKYLENQSRTVLHSAFRSPSLVVIDEFDFYGPREASLLLTMVELMAAKSDVNPQIAVLTATMANPGEVCEWLKKINGRECSIVDGEPFSVSNKIYIVLGKNLEEVWKYLGSFRGSLSKADPDILKALEDFEEFKKSAYRVVSYLQALGFEVPSLGVDVREILRAYADDEGVTLVFTRSIARAEELARSLREYLGDLVASHHHLVDKRVRELVEERARRGEVKVVVSPRTLTQGIDIGTVVRVVHVGLPEDVREFFQREGRKGRRPDIPFTETIIVPSTRWDWELLTKGFEALSKWLSLPLEKVAVHPDNSYSKLFRALAKAVSPWLGEKLAEDEAEILRGVGVLKSGGIDESKLRKLWNYINFYEYGPPYGVKRYLETEQGLVPLEPIGRCDLVEKFQVGCIDPSQDAVVVALKHGSKSRFVQAVIEKPLRRVNFYEHEALAEALEEYMYIKRRWGEEASFASFLRDIARGKLSSEVLAVVYPPKSGFGELRKVPNRTIWFLESSRPRIVSIGGRTVVTFDKKPIFVPANTAGEYRDYTYGMLFETQDAEDSTLLRLGLAYLMVVLRKRLSLPLDALSYGVERLGEKKFFEIHETEYSGFLERAVWTHIRRIVEEYEPDYDLDLILLNQVDELAYSDLLALGLGLESLKELSLRVVDYILSKQRIRAVLAGRKISIPRPGKHLKLASLDFVGIMLAEDSVVPRLVYAASMFDGESSKTVTGLYVKLPGVPPPSELRSFEVAVEDLVDYGGFTLLVMDRAALLNDASKANLKILRRMVEQSVSVSEELKKLGFASTSPWDFVEAVDADFLRLGRADIAEVHRVLSDIVSERGEEITEIPDKLRRVLSSYVEERAKLIYLLHLVAQALGEPEK